MCNCGAYTNFSEDMLESSSSCALRVASTQGRCSTHRTHASSQRIFESPAEVFHEAVILRVVHRGQKMLNPQHQTKGGTHLRGELSTYVRNYLIWHTKPASSAAKECSVQSRTLVPEIRTAAAHLVGRSTVVSRRVYPSPETRKGPTRSMCMWANFLLGAWNWLD